jgi:hypothetical protein
MPSKGQSINQQTLQVMSYEVKEIKGNKITVEIEVPAIAEWSELPISEKGNRTITTSRGMQPLVYEGKVLKLGFNLLYKDSTFKPAKK